VDEVVQQLDALVRERGGEGCDGGGGVAEVDDELGEDAVSDAEVGLQLRADLETSESCMSRRIPSPTVLAPVAATIAARMA
jgi:hypothetical protein